MSNVRHGKKPELPAELQWLAGDVVQVARRLLGCELEVDTPNGLVRLRIVETEAYHETDAASHSYKGRTPRTDVMFGPPGYLYVYFTYGMHYCMNIVTGPQGEGSAVLLRAAEPLEGLDIMRQYRAGRPDAELVNGPAKLCQATAITKEQNGLPLWGSPVRLKPMPHLGAAQIVQTTRVGITQAKDVPWRFYIRDNVFISQT